MEETRKMVVQLSKDINLTNNNFRNRLDLFDLRINKSSELIHAASESGGTPFSPLKQELVNGGSSRMAASFKSNIQRALATKVKT